MPNNTSDTIQVKVSRVYGRELIMPVCDTGKFFARLTGTKTLTREHISLIKTMGYGVDVLQDKIEL